jgi:hypothetical protein
MHNNKNDRDEPMEVDDKNNSSTRSKRDNDNDQLMTEAVFFADLLNSKLRSLTKEDAERFMEKFENSVVLLPKNQVGFFYHIKESRNLFSCLMIFFVFYQSWAITGYCCCS